MTGEVVVVLAQAVEQSPPRQYAVDLVAGLSGMGVDTRVVLLRDGVVSAALEPHAPVHHMPDLGSRTPAGVAEGLVRRAVPAAAPVVRRARTARRRSWVGAPAVVHLNGPQAVSALRLLDQRPRWVTTYVHPADLGIADLAPVDRDLLVDRTDRFLAADEATADATRAAVGAVEVEVAPDPLVFPVAPLAPADRDRARTGLGVPVDRPLVAVPPVPDWMDAPDLTVALAWELERRHGDGGPAVLWYGASTDPRRRWPIEHDLRRVGLTSVRLVEDGLDPASMLAAADLVVLPSRTSHPVGARFVDEAAAHGAPVLCWSGDPLADAVDEWTGLVVERPDVAAMADAIDGVLADRERLRSLVAAGRERLLAAIDRVVPDVVPR